MHEMQTIVADVPGVCLSVCPSFSLSVTLLNSAARAVCGGGVIRCSFSKLLWPLVHSYIYSNVTDVGLTCWKVRINAY